MLPSISASTYILVHTIHHHHHQTVSATSDAETWVMHPQMRTLSALKRQRIIAIANPRSTPQEYPLAGQMLGDQPTCHLLVSPERCTYVRNTIAVSGHPSRHILPDTDDCGLRLWQYGRCCYAVTVFCSLSTSLCGSISAHQH